MSKYTEGAITDLNDLEVGELYSYCDDIEHMFNEGCITETERNNKLAQESSEAVYMMFIELANLSQYDFMLTSLATKRYHKAHHIKALKNANRDKKLYGVFLVDGTKQHLLEFDEEGLIKISLWKYGRIYPCNTKEDVI